MAVATSSASSTSRCSTSAGPVAGMGATVTRPHRTSSTCTGAAAVDEPAPELEANRPVRSTVVASPGGRGARAAMDATTIGPPACTSRYSESATTHSDRLVAICRYGCPQMLPRPSSGEEDVADTLAGSAGPHHLRGLV